MLRFNKPIVYIFVGSAIISIHPMLRFNLYKSITCYTLRKFQYILCYGSTRQVFHTFYTFTLFQYILCYGSTRIGHSVLRFSKYISIHPMLRFNHEHVNARPHAVQISIHPMLRFNPNWIKK